MYVQFFVRNDYMVMIEAWDVFKIVFGPPRWDWSNEWSVF